MLKWLEGNPLIDAKDIQYLKDALQVQRAAAEWNAASKAEAKESDEKAGRAWYSSIPMLHLIIALVHSDEIRHAYLTRNDILNKWIIADNQKSFKKRAKIVEWLHFLSLLPIKSTRKSKQRMFTFIASLEIGSAVGREMVELMLIFMESRCLYLGMMWRKKPKKSEFGQLKNCSCGALNTRAAFIGTYQPYLLYYWEMLDKYQLFSTSFSELN
jgi:hypothetical protein